ncbi:MAG: cysteine--tRNA ligase [Lachnospiraceae bacterium]|nr:cysteine--tRNA ligase [Lachnospiraceae bacterium]
MSKVFLYNTLTNKVDEFKPENPPEVKMYTCGPTVYHYAHIGNLRSYIMEDVLERYLNYAGYRVNRVMNITDVGHLTSDADTGEDKMLKGAKREHKSVMEIAKFYEDAFFSDCEKLNIKKPETVEPATGCISDFINVIEKLEEKDFAYKAGGNVYFDTSKLDSYYKLSNQNEEELKSAVREDVDVDENKKNKTDFVLWFTKSKFDNQELKWKSPWGTGYPGWHIECSCIGMKHLGETLDIHCGGVDNIFPHHTNEIAQSEAFVGHDWCKHWFHVQHLNVDSGKMSKSDNNFLTVSLLEEKGYNPLAYRFFCLQSHYRKPLLFNFSNLDNAAQSFDKLLKRLNALVKEAEVKLEHELTDEDLVIEPTEEPTCKFDEIYAMYKAKFEEALGNDLNTAQGFTVVYDVLKAEICARAKLRIINDFDKVFALDLVNQAKSLSDNAETGVDDEKTEFILKKIEERKAAKKNKDFATADAIRDELLGMGIELKDTREGTVWSVVK